MRLLAKNSRKSKRSLCERCALFELRADNEADEILLSELWQIVARDGICAPIATMVTRYKRRPLKRAQAGEEKR